MKFGDGAIRTRMAGKLTDKPQQTEGGWYVGSNIGTEAPLECWVFDDVVDPAGMATSLADLNLQAMEQVYGPVQDRGIYHIDAGAFDGTPYVALEWLYSVGEAEEKRIGLVKVRVAVEHELSYACMHNSLGYRATFATAFEQFVREARFPVPAESPYYEEVLVQRIAGSAIGISRSTFTLDSDGDTKIVTLQSSLLPVDNANLQSSDTWQVVYSRPDGTLINQTLAKSENGELTMQLSLDPEGGDLWFVSGTLQGKEFEREVAATARPMSELGQMLAVRALIADPDELLATLTIWAPEADPTRFLDAVVELDAMARGEGRGVLRLGALAIAAQFEPSGSMLAGAMQVGSAEITMERVWANGSLPPNEHVAQRD
ncbi:MAG TPA: hypothetical protein VLT59_15365 [Steroidobacteraceae bacterium]|nr:hypothetical protein [Steroidobacteraceae bacterium]